MKELILINLGGNRYGVWKDDVLSVRDVSGIHWIPMSTELFSGIAGIEGRTANLFDLAVCLGHKPFDRKRQGRALIMSERGKFEGFVFDSEAGRIEAPPESVLPMPGCLESPEVTECVYDSGETVPIINIVLLYKRIREKRWGPCVFSFPKSAPRGSKPLSGVFRAFTIEGEAFAVPDEMVEPGAGEPGRIHPLPTAPPHVQGVVFKDSGVRAVVNLARCMGEEGFPKRGRMLLAKSGGLAFVVDKDMGRLKGKVPHAPMPRIAASGFIGHALLRKGEVVPLLDVHAPVSRNPAKAFSKKYTPRSKFYESFGKKEARVYEFSLSGLRQSVPDPQVEDVVGVKPWRELRGIHPMMAGVAEHGGEVLPVLDLSACFGRHTEVGPGAKMMLLKNGNFRALVLAEAVLGRRTLAVSEQRTLPIRLPHLYVYGCYTHDNSVRLILNVEALTSHFDEKLVSEYLEMVAKEIEAAEALAGGPETGRKAATAAPVPGAYPAEEDVPVPVASFGEAEAIGDDSFAESGEEEVSEFVASLGEEEREEEPVKEETGPDEEETPAPAASFGGAEAEVEGAAPVASFGEAGGEDTLVGPGEDEVSEPTASFGDAGRGDEPAEEDAEPEAGADAAETVASFGGAEAIGDDSFAEAGEEDVSESVASVGETGQEDEPVKEETEPYGKDTPESDGEETPEPAASFGGAEAIGEDTLVEPGEDEVLEPAASFGDTGRGDEPAEEETGAGADAAETVVSYGETERVEQPAEEQGAASPGQAAGEKTMLDASPGTFGSLDEPGDEEEREGEAPPPSGEYLAASSKGKERNLGLYAAAVLLLFLTIFLLAYFRGHEAERAGEKVVSLADTKEARVETVLPEEEPVSSEEEPVSSEEEPVSSEEELVSSEEELVSSEEELVSSEEELAEPLSGLEETPVKPVESIKPVEPVKARPGRERRAEILIELEPEKGEISMRVVHATPPDAKVYEVVKGDTLWHIARRFTGNPFNYPRIARDSEIKNPDLIFPGQKVYIRIKGE
jgi:chemotaxis signal transduction protein/LysM repeat protein